MSAEVSPAEQAYDTIVTELAAPYFFEKLAAHGIHPQSDEEAADLWEAASKLHAIHAQAEPQKTAATTKSRFAELNAQLSNALGSEPVALDFDKAAAAVVSNEPALASAILTLQAAARSTQPE